MISSALLVTIFGVIGAVLVVVAVIVSFECFLFLDWNPLLVPHADCFHRGLTVLSSAEVGTARIGCLRFKANLNLRGLARLTSRADVIKLRRITSG